MNDARPPIAVTPAEWAIVRDVLARVAPGIEVWAFGSRATGRAKAYSDLDLALIAAAPLPLDLTARLAEAFSDSDLPWKVDLVDWAAAGDAFRDIIAKQRVVVQRAPTPS